MRTLIPIRIDRTVERQIRGTVIPLAEPLELDLRDYAYVISVPNVRRAFRLLSNINEDVLASYRIHALSQNRSDLLESMQFLEWALTTLKQRSGAQVLYKTVFGGLAAIEEDNLSKIRLANGYVKTSFLRDAVYPWAPARSCPRPLEASSITEMVRWYQAIVKKNGLIDPSTIFRPGKGTSWPTITYKKGSSYGLFPYVAGSSPLSGAALLWHAYVASAAQILQVRQKSSDWDRTFRRALSDCSSGQYPAELPSGCGMLLRRARGLKDGKIMPYWHTNATDKTLSASHGEADTRSASRDIKALPAYVNMLYSPTSQWYSDLYRCIPGLHAGHPSWTEDILSVFAGLHGADKVKFLVADISSYDNSTCYAHLMHLAEFEAELFKDAADTAVGFHDFVARIPVATRGLFDRNVDEITILRRSGGIASGFQGTTVQGTQNVTPCIITAMARIMNRDFGSVLRSSINYCLSLAPEALTSRDHTWGWLNKGDDLLIFSLADVSPSETDLKQAFAELGYSLDFEPQPLFLMVAYGLAPVGGYLSKTSRLRGSHYYGTGRQAISTGLILKRLASRFIFSEHAITHDIVWPIALLGTFEHCEAHPLYPEALSFALKRLRRVFPQVHTKNDLTALVASGNYVTQLQRYALSASQSSPYLQEAIRKYFGAEGAWAESSEMVEGSLAASVLSRLRLPPIDPTGVLRGRKLLQLDEGRFTAKITQTTANSSEYSLLTRESSALLMHILSQQDQG